MKKDNRVKEINDYALVSYNSAKLSGKTIYVTESSASQTIETLKQKGIYSEK